MMPYKPFAIEQPSSLDGLRSALKTMGPGTLLMAGGTDIMPNLKNGLYDIERIISLKQVEDLRRSTVDDNTITLGAMTTLHHLGNHHKLQKLLPALTHASLSIASPQIRAMGTIGGNICLDTRCLYFNQSEFWRKSLGYCLKKDGDVCHVTKTGKRCVAAASNDVATVLLAYNASLSVVSPYEQRVCYVRDFYHADGVNNKHLRPDEVISSISIDVTKKKYGGFYKLRHRESIDFPLLSVAVCFELDKGILTNCTVVVNALVAKPKVIEITDFCGRAYNQQTVLDIAKMAEEKCHPQTNICDNTWRKTMTAISVQRAFFNALKYVE